MSMFRKPKKPMLRKVFADEDERMDTDEERPSSSRDRHREDRHRDKHRNDREKSKPKSSSSSSTQVTISGVEKKPKALLSFVDDGKWKNRHNWVTEFMVFVLVLFFLQRRKTKCSKLRNPIKVKKFQGC